MKKIKKSKKSFTCYLIKTFAVAAFAVPLAACATVPKLPPAPPKYVYKENSRIKPSHYANNSLWTDQASLYEDLRARRLNDLVTINVLENITGSGQANTKTSRDSSLNASVTGFFGAPLNAGLSNLFGNGNTFSPSVAGSMQDSYKGAGETDRAGTLVGTITAEVVEVLPNGNLVLESRKEITINNEKQMLIFQGIARPTDIASDNTISSSRIAGAKVYFVGDGVVQEKQAQGWLVRLLDRVWPF
ncbi:MAG: flagellar basal body L-ring protein FlgH [Nitrospiraceae bacterium]|nr:flagellar basal body L-ring protein FlgH [Nitrospiraceae bacterium]